MFFLVPPMIAAQAAVPLKDIGIVLEALEGVSESLTDGKPAQQIPTKTAKQQGHNSL